jgi:hypothetical protein
MLGIPAGNHKVFRREQNHIDSNTGECKVNLGGRLVNFGKRAVVLGGYLVGTWRILDKCHLSIEFAALVAKGAGMRWTQRHGELHR